MFLAQQTMTRFFEQNQFYYFNVTSPLNPIRLVQRFSTPRQIPSEKYVFPEPEKLLFTASPTATFVENVFPPSHLFKLGNKKNSLGAGSGE